ncbi:SDR family NAD(P)-dependent oxidoreductase [Actinocrinis sp.]|uniref:SDR family NAD(P)-dependent oxidoreductase n=1 Tax=Actinocrinis sp. TaxID=1920516 RepID=UPI002B9ABA49|nr:SDR family NAD(P)-dependent oxidoreductase [Actinocrinis sp.]HXR74137.1 SDR family NAD(P)-dependent oxidoreductase [Actinocrinis sp.]
MTRVFITGSVDGLGRAAAHRLIGAGHQVVLHARSATRAADLGELAKRAAGVVIGDLSSARETRDVADQVNELGVMDAVIHNAGVYTSAQRVATTDGHAQTLAVNVLAPYLLTATLRRPARLIYLSSGMHRGGDASLRDLDWTARRWSWMQAYSDSKLFVTALTFAVARAWPEVLSNAVDPGWVPTKMGGPGASDDLELGHRTQEWLATSDDPEALVTGGYWFHQRRQTPAAAAEDADFQNRLLEELARLTGVRLP